MVAGKLIELIELHAERMAADVTQELMTSERTPGFRSVRRPDLEERIFRIVHDLGDWVGQKQSPKVREEFFDWGRRRFGQGISLSEIIYAMIIFKQHLRRYVREHGVIEATFPRTNDDYVLPMHLNSLQELNAEIGGFFDEALYHLCCGYEESSRLNAVK